jgi:hypothetical protein
MSVWLRRVNADGKLVANGALNPPVADACLQILGEQQIHRVAHLRKKKAIRPFNPSHYPAPFYMARDLNRAGVWPTSDENGNLIG